MSQEGVSSRKHHQSNHSLRLNDGLGFRTQRNRFPLPGYQKLAYFLKYTSILDQENTLSKNKNQTDNVGLFAFFMSSKTMPKF